MQINYKLINNASNERKQMTRIYGRTGIFGIFVASP